MSNVNEVLMMGAHKSAQHFIWDIYGTDSAETWACVQDPVKSMGHEHMVLLWRNGKLNQHSKMGFHSQQRHIDLNSLYGLSQASHAEVAKHHVLWCAILSLPLCKVNTISLIHWGFWARQANWGRKKSHKETRTPKRLPSKVIKANSMNETVLMKTEVALKAVITKQGSDMKISGKVIVWLSQVYPYSLSASSPCKWTPGTEDLSTYLCKYIPNGDTEILGKHSYKFLRVSVLIIMNILSIYCQWMKDFLPGFSY